MTTAAAVTIPLPSDPSREPGRNQYAGSPGPNTLKTCAKFWQPIETRCKGCPIERECSTWTPTTREGIAAHAATCEAAATRALG